VLFLYSAQITGKVSAGGLEDEQSLTYVAFSACLDKERSKYLKEKDARYAMLKKHDSDEEVDDNENVFD
jgi:hypothetical protein